MSSSFKLCPCPIFSTNGFSKLSVQKYFRKEAKQLLRKMSSEKATQKSVQSFQWRQLFIIALKCFCHRVSDTKKHIKDFFFFFAILMDHYMYIVACDLGRTHKALNKVLKLGYVQLFSLSISYDDRRTQID